MKIGDLIVYRDEIAGVPRGDPEVGLVTRADDKRLWCIWLGAPGEGEVWIYRRDAEMFSEAPALPLEIINEG